jgi:hypothetical protein
MQNSRFSEIQNLNKVISGAALSKKEELPKPTKKKILLYGIPTELYDAIEGTHESFSSFARRAIIKLAKEEGVII